MSEAVVILSEVSVVILSEARRPCGAAARRGKNLLRTTGAGRPGLHAFQSKLVTMRSLDGDSSGGSALGAESGSRYSLSYR
jgi:hypothetical protein